MKKILNALNRRFEVSREKRLSEIIAQFSLAEKTIFIIFVILMSLGALILLNKVNESLKVEVPRFGGTLSEGIVGSPRFINPVLAISDADKDVTSLVYAGLMRMDDKGNIILGLAESYDISEDKLTYGFKISSNAIFHDGSPVTADDVIFTINKILDPNIKSPRRANWEGVIVEKINEREVKFTLKKPYAPFLEITTMGILPKNIWKNTSNELFPFSTFNIEPIGAGPYRFESVDRNPDGTVLSYQLKSFNDYIGGMPNIENIILNFYNNEETMLNEFVSGNIDSVSGISPHTSNNVDSEITTNKFPLTRVFGVYFNQNQSAVLRNIEVRSALASYVNREKIISDALYGFGVEIKSPVPLTEKEYFDLKAYPDSIKENDLENAKAILAKAGWKAGTDGVLEKKVAKDKSKETETIRLEFTISTGNVPELKEAAEILKEDWEKIGAKIDVKIYETGDLNQNIIRPRKFDAVLFGQVVGRDLDLYSYWSSSQRNDPGLNIAMYTDTNSDKLLDDLRATFDDQARKDKIIKWVNTIKNDIPAIFLFSPEFIYETSSKLRGVNIGAITKSSDRWNGVENWYVETDKVWKILVNK